MTSKSSGFGRELRRGTLELVLLRLLRDRAMYGYELVTELDSRSGGRLDVKEGTLYPVLYRLEDQQLIEPTWQQRGRGVPRKYYALTAAGKGRLAELQDEWRRFSGTVSDLLADTAGDTERQG